MPDTIDAHLKTATDKISEAEDALGAEGKVVDKVAVQALHTAAGDALKAATGKLADAGDKRPSYQGRINSLKASLSQQDGILKSIPEPAALKKP